MKIYYVISDLMRSLIFFILSASIALPHLFFFLATLKLKTRNEQNEQQKIKLNKLNQKKGMNKKTLP